LSQIPFRLAGKGGGIRPLSRIDVTRKTGGDYLVGGPVAECGSPSAPLALG